MKLPCIVCRAGVTRPKLVTRKMERGAAILMIRGIPAEVCHTCGEKYFADETTTELLRMAEDAARAGVVGTSFRVFSGSV